METTPTYIKVLKLIPSYIFLMISEELSMSMVCNEATLVPYLTTLSIANFTSCIWKLCVDCHEETKVFGEKPVQMSVFPTKMPK